MFQAEISSFATEKLVPVFTGQELTRLEHACAGRSFAHRRDTTIIAVLRATGIRLLTLGPALGRICVADVPVLALPHINWMTRHPVDRPWRIIRFPGNELPPS